MADEPQERASGSILDSSDGSTTGEQQVVDPFPFIVAPATADQKNTLRPWIKPIACWKLDDIRFDFDSCFVKPQAEPDLKKLAALVDAHKKSPLSIFGHADPVGQEAYNKTLSGRRAMVIYGLLIRDADLWERLASSGQDNWGTTQHAAMLDALGYSAQPSDGIHTGAASSAVKEFQSPRGLTAHGYLNAATKKKLYTEYMDKLCGADFKLQKSQFLGKGADPDGRGDYQGCSEFNPLVIMSKEENDQLSKPANHTQRNAVNAPNRRVMVLLFQKDVRINTARWPCPKADTDQVQACKKRFWSDSADRLKNADERRTLSKHKNTYACRFYDRLTNFSPCEQTREYWVLRILIAGTSPLQDRKPLANEAYTVTGAGAAGVIKGRTDHNGALRVPVTGDPASMTLSIAGVQIAVQGGGLREIDDGETAIRQRLYNLGYGKTDYTTWTGGYYTNLLNQFQKQHDLPETIAVDAATKEKLKDIHGS